MGVLPLQFADGDTVSTLGLTGHEVFSVSGIAAMNAGPVPPTLTVRADDPGPERPGAGSKEFSVRLRIDTPKEADYYRHGGILQYVARQLAGV
jgi:aconitate hydratase